jgi:hypothetical protein
VRTLRWFGIAAAAVSAFAFFAALRLRGQLAEMKDWVSTHGVVSRIDRHVHPSRDRDQPDEVDYEVLVTYSVADTRYTTSQRVASEQSYRTGQEVTVRYAPTQPGAGRVAGDVEDTYHTQLLLGAVGAVAAVVLFGIAQARRGNTI